MNLNEYASRKQNLLQRMIAALMWVFRQYLVPNITRSAWSQLMRVVYRVMKPFRDEVTELARQFYDDNRFEQTGAERHDIFKDDYYPEEWMRQALEPTYQELSKTRNADAAVVDISNRLVKVVEDGARRTTIQGIINDISQPLRGWARFDPRPPTCAFCTMMISRGPVYSEAITAGLDLDDQSAEELMQSIHPERLSDDERAELAELMNRWHPGCTCIVVPVYKRSGYPSERQEREALAIYNRARRAAEEKTFKSILKAMRSQIRNPQDDQDETTLPASA